MTEPNQPTAAGKSSYDLIDKDLFWQHLAVAPGMTVLDLACGAGRYTLPLAGQLGKDSTVIAVDLWAEGIAQLTADAATAGLSHVKALVADVSKPFDVADASVDVCLMATVLHDLVDDGLAEGALDQVMRVLKPDGVLAVVEFNKIDGPPGPPKAVRMSIDQVTALLLRRRMMRHSGIVELGDYLYMAHFKRLGSLMKNRAGVDGEP